MTKKMLVPLVFLIAGCGESAVERCIAQLSDKDVELRRQAARELVELKPPDAETKRALQEAIADSDREVRRLACVALGEVGAADAAALESALDDRELSVQLAAAFAILKTDAENQSAIAALQKAMKLGEGGVIVAVSKMGPKAPWAAPTLVGLLRDRRPGIRRLAAEGLGQVGMTSRNVTAALTRAQQDPDDRVRDAASHALERLRGPAGK